MKNTLLFRKPSPLLIWSFVLLFLLTTQISRGQGNIIVERIGSGSSALTANAQPVSLFEISSNGLLINTYALPNSANRPSSSPYNLMESGTAAAGFLTRSTDKKFICVPGYNAIATDALVNSSSSATVARTIGMLNAAGTISPPTAAFTIFNGLPFRSLASDGTHFWAAGQGITGTSTGVYYLESATATSATSVGLANVRTVAIYNGQLYYSVAGKIVALGTGLPSASATATDLPGLTGTSFYGFAINPAGTVCYVADDGTTASGGGIRKYTFNGVIWSLAYVVYTASPNVRGLIVDWTNADTTTGVGATLYATTATTTTANALLKVKDIGQATTATTLYTAPINTVFRGLAFAPEKGTPTVTVFPGNYTYNGLAQGPTFAINSGTGSSYTFSYSGVGQTTYGPSPIPPTNAGSYSVTATVAASGDLLYNSASSTTLFTIEKAITSVTIPGENYVYNGTPQGPSVASVTGSSGAITYVYEGYGNTVYGPSTTQPTNAGSYTVYATVEADDNFLGVTSSATLFSILKSITSVTIPGGNYAYNGTPQGPSVASVTGSSGAITYVYEGYGNTVYGPSTTQPTNAGSYTVYATVEADDNFLGVTSAPFYFQIIEAPLCPASTAVTPSGSQTICAGTSANLLTANITNTGVLGTPTYSYQWYYNTTNSNTVLGATVVSGATAATFTPASTATEIGNRWYFCVGYSTDNSCGQSVTDQSLASNAVSIAVTVNTLLASSLSSNGSLCLGTCVLSISGNLSDYSKVQWMNNNIPFDNYNTNANTVAGGNGIGSTSNKLAYPNAIKLDASGNLYIADGNNNRIQKWLPGATAGITVAGGYGTGASQFDQPRDLFIDAAGNLYIADLGNQRIQKWLPGATSGITVAGGNGYGNAANQLYDPTGVFVDGNGNIFISDFYNERVQKWTPGATAGITVAGGNGTGSASNQLSGPQSVFVDLDGNIFISDEGNHRIQKWIPGATAGITVAGGNGSGSASNQLKNPSYVIIDSTGNLFISDRNNNRVQKWASGASTGTTLVGGTSGSLSNQLNYPQGIIVTNQGTLYVTDKFNNRIQKFNNNSTTFTPTTSGVISVSLTNNNSCSIITNSLTVNALPTLSANTGGATTVCVNTSTPAFTNAQSGGIWSIVAGTGTASVSTDGVVTGLTTGTVSVVYTYNNGTCSNSVSSSVTVPNMASGAASSTPTLCINTALTNITHTTTDATGIGSATGLPSGVTAVWASNTITISGTPTQSGTFSYSIPLTGGCGSANATGTIFVDPALNAPTNLVVTPINTGGMIVFTAPTNSSGCAITNYQYSTDNGITWVTPYPAVTQSPLMISGLVNCTTYLIKIRAVNASDSSTASVAANLTPTASVNMGINWTSRTSAANNNWYSVTYGNGLFVAVANTGTGNRVMTSPDGITWTSRTSAADNSWFGVTYGNGLFVAVSSNGTGNRVMTSPDGITWTSRTSAANNTWTSVTYGNGLFVAVANSGIGNRVMTSPDGITWTARTSAADNNWYSVTYGNGLFVAVSGSGTNNRVMTSSDGITWTARTSAADNSWLQVTYGNGLFVAVAFTGTGNRVMTSPNGITWTARTSAADNSWYGVTYGNGLFVAVAANGTNRVMTSPDGITWTARTSAANNFWDSVTYGNGQFVAVSISGTGNRVMTSNFSVAPNAPVITGATLTNTTANIAFTQTTSTSVPSVSNYEYSTNNGNSWTAVSPAATTSPLTITGFAPSSIMIRAVNSVGNSCPSNKDITLCIPTSSTETISACYSYLWHGTTYTSSNNTATWTDISPNGCDHVVTLNLTITPNLPTFTNFNSSSTAMDNSLVITGTNFTGTTSVRFGETPALFTVNSNTQITAIVPRVANTGKISLSTNSCGSTLSSSIPVSRQSSSNIFSIVTAAFNAINDGIISAPAFTDLDGDGLLDMIVGEHAGNLNHYEQNSANSTSFTLVTANFNGISGLYYSRPTFTDLDGDGLLDMIIGRDNGTLWHYEQNTANSTSFTLRTPSFNGINVGDQSAPTFTDLDGDGLLDMLVGKFDGNLNHYEQNAANSTSFTLITDTFNGIDVGIYSSPFFTDLDGDGLLDMISGEINGTLYHYEQNAANSTSFTLVTANFNGINVGYESRPTITDIDGDGLLDLIVGEYDGNLNHYEQNQSPVISTLSVNPACVGATVSITGAALTGATSVTINGTSVGTLSGVTDTNITFTVPTNATSGNVVVTTPNGTSNLVSLTVSPNNTIEAASSTPTLCMNTPLTNITHATTGATAIGTATGLPAGVTAAWASNTITISGTPTAAGTFNYSIPLTGGCGSANATGTITVTTPTTWYADADSDGYGAGTAVLSCSGQPVNTVTNNTDCAPTDGTKWQLGTFYTDADGDGYNNGAPQSAVCYGSTIPSGYIVSNIGTDCLDSNAEVNPNHVEVLGNEIDDNCDGVVDEVAPTSAVLASQCNATLTNLSNTIYAGQVSGAQGYRFEVTEVGNPTNVRTYETEYNRFNLSNLSGGATYATTYSIRVAVKTAPGFWRAFSTTCTVTTPAVAATTTISSPACGITLSNIEATIYCIAVPNATGYRFRVTDGVTTSLVQTTVNRFSLASANANFGTTYAVDVQLKFGTTWETTWGSVCSFTTPATPGTSNVSAAQCGINIANLWATIYATQVAVATGYRFEVTKGAQTVYYDTPNSRFSLRNITVPGFTTANASYSIRVSIKYNNIYRAFGTPCTITTNGASRVTTTPVEVFEVKAYPNPFAANFKLEINTSSESTVGVKVYDMIGRLIETHQSAVPQMTTLEIGNLYPTGVYTIVVTQGDKVKTLRVIKR